MNRLFNVYMQKVRTFALIILVLSGFHSHRLQYMQKVHTYSANIRYISEVYFNFVED